MGRKMKAIIFDMDGTLFQTDVILESSLEDTFDQLRSIGQWEGELPIRQYRNIMGLPLPKVWEVLLPTHSSETREKANEYFHEKLIHNIETGKGALYPNVENVFTQLKKEGYSIFIASNGLTAYLTAIVAFYRLDRWVTETFSIQQATSLNKGELVETIIKKYEVECGAVVGDRLSDINAAKDNQLVSVGCRFDFSQEDELALADFIIEDLNELINLLPEITHRSKSMVSENG